MSQTSLKAVPSPLAPVPFNVPSASKTTLENGLRVIIFKNNRLPLTSFRLAFLSGDINDPPDSIGLTSALSTMLTEGTENYSSLQLAEKVERLGASVSASSSDDFTIVSGSSLSLYNSEILSLIAEIVFSPTFPENELDLYRRNTIENLKFQRSQPNFLASEQTARVIFGGHPYSRISPAAADIEKLRPELLFDLHRKAFIPNNAVLMVVGDVEIDSILEEVNTRFGDWPKGAVAVDRPPQPAELERSRLTVVDRPGSAQANIVLSNLGVARNDPEYFPVVVMNQVLGAGASSRIFMNLREEKGYTYGAYSRFDMKKLSGSFEATAEVRTSVTGESLKEFFYELNRIRDEDVSEEELDDAKNFLTGVFPIRAETQEGMTNLIVTQELYDLPEDYLQTYREHVSAVSVEDVKRVANRFIHPERMSIVIVGDANEILPQARDRADEIAVFDADGRGKTVG